MSLTQIQKLQLNKQVDRILHAPGNQPASRQQLEMAFVFDGFSDMEYLKSTAQDAVAALKAHDKIFQNVRSNVVFWNAEKIKTETMPMSFIQMGKPFVDLKKTKVSIRNLKRLFYSPYLYINTTGLCLCVMEKKRRN